MAVAEPSFNTSMDSTSSGATVFRLPGTPSTNTNGEVPPFNRKLTDARFTLLTVQKDLSQGVQALLSRHHHRLELLQQRVADASPDKLLSRGYSITLKDGKAVTDAASLLPGDQLVTRLAKGSFTSEVRHR